MTEKNATYIAVWAKYLPAIKILIKKSVAGEQIIGMNRSDFDKAAGIKKSGYRFTLNFINGNVQGLLDNNGFAKSFISVLQSDGIIKDQISKNNYSFIFTNKYKLQIINNGPSQQAELPVLEDQEMLLSQ